MDNELEKLVDGVWNSTLERLCKKDISPIRPSLGDYIDLLIPQSRTIFMLKAKPETVPVMYRSVYDSAKRNSFNIMKKLGMPADYFWKFEYWPPERAFETLKRVINRVFTAIMSRNKEGGLELTGVDSELIRFSIDFQECAECAGIEGSRAFCFYHTATFAGIMAALFNREMDAFEPKCRAKGDEICHIVIGKSDDSEIKAKVAEYLQPVKLETDISQRLLTGLEGKPLRNMGNLVNIGYYQLMLLNSMMAEPVSGSSFDIGREYGTQLAPVLTAFYQARGLDILQKYYNQMHHLDIKLTDVGEAVEITLTECAELPSMLQRKELVNFLFGELQGLVADLKDPKLVYRESWFENVNLKVRFSP